MNLISIVAAAVIASASQTPAPIPDDATAILREARTALGALESWKADVVCAQTISSLATTTKGTVEVHGDRFARADLIMDLIGMGNPPTIAIRMDETGIWNFQTSFGQTALFHTAVPAGEPNRMEFMNRLVMTGGFSLGRLDVAEFLWWIEHGWDLKLRYKDALELPGAVHLTGLINSLPHAEEAFMRWPKSDLHRMDLFLSHDRYFPARVRITNLGGRQVMQLDYTNVELNKAPTPADFAFEPPADTDLSDMTEIYRKQIEPIMKLRHAGE